MEREDIYRKCSALRETSCAIIHICGPKIHKSLIRFCLIFLSFSSHSRIFHSLGDVTITRERQQILTYIWHSWQLSSEGSLECPTCDTDQPIIMVIYRTCDTYTCCWAFGSGAVTTCFNNLGLSWPEIEPRSPACKTYVLPLGHCDG